MKKKTSKKKTSKKKTSSKKIEVVKKPGTSVIEGSWTELPEFFPNNPFRLSLPCFSDSWGYTESTNTLHHYREDRVRVDYKMPMWFDWALKEYFRIGESALRGKIRDLLKIRS